MRETETVTELVEEEREVERIYCDGCDDIVEEPVYEVRELCDSCSRGVNIYNNIEEAMVSANEESGMERSLSAILVVAIFVPVVWHNCITRRSNSLSYVVLATSLGALLWVGGAAAILLFLL